MLQMGRSCSQNGKQIYKTIVLPVLLHGCETRSHKLREKLRLRVFEKRIPRRMFGPKRDENGGGKGPTMRNFIICTFHLTYPG